MGDVKFNVEPTWVDIDSVHPNDWNVNEMTPEQEEALERSIEEDGFVAQVIECLPDGTILDGEHRWRILKRKGAKKVPVVYSEKTEDEARLATLKRNRIRGEPEMYGLGRELAHLTEQFGDEKVMLDLAMDPQELEDLIALFDGSLEEMPDHFACLDQATGQHRGGRVGTLTREG